VAEPGTVVAQGGVKGKAASADECVWGARARMDRDRSDTAPRRGGRTSLPSRHCASQGRCSFTAISILPVFCVAVRMLLNRTRDAGLAADKETDELVQFWNRGQGPGAWRAEANGLHHR
jgi:hypothetical protein